MRKALHFFRPEFMNNYLGLHFENNFKNNHNGSSRWYPIFSIGIVLCSTLLYTGGLNKLFSNETTYFDTEYILGEDAISLCETVPADKTYFEKKDSSIHKMDVDLVVFQVNNVGLGQ